MRTTTLGSFTISRLCLGAMLMGGDTPAGEAHRMLDRFREAGGTFVDTADTYGDGASERTLAPWLARHRDEVVVATKVRFAVSDPGGAGLSPDRIRAACDTSLRRLGVAAPIIGPRTLTSSTTASNSTRTNAARWRNRRRHRRSRRTACCTTSSASRTRRRCAAADRASADPARHRSPPGQRRLTHHTG
jgi:hypothetical protein